MFCQYSEKQIVALAPGIPSGLDIAPIWLLNAVKQPNNARYLDLRSNSTWLTESPSCGLWRLLSTGASDLHGTVVDQTRDFCSQLGAGYDTVDESMFQ